MIVVKVGGSLYDHPRLGPGLRAYLASLASSPVLLVPGGGPFADAVRKLDAIHGLGEQRSHWLALASLWAAGAFLRELVPGSHDAAHPATDPRAAVRVLDCRMFCEVAGDLPHSWAVTSDSIAGRAAAFYRADRLVLLKSVEIPPQLPWQEAAAAGHVDPHFPKLTTGAPFAVQVVNFRRWLDDFALPEEPSRPA